MIHRNYYNAQEAARIYRSRGFAVCRPLPGEKCPTKRGWTLRSAEPEEFREDDSIGIMGGRLSGDLLIVDLDHPRAVELADKFLPPTGMEEGRAGKPRSHRYYRVENIVLEPPSTCAEGVGGPAILHFHYEDGEKKRAAVDVIGTGGQVVAPCSVWISKDGTQREHRFWHAFSEPKVIDQAELLEAVAALARECGAKSSRWENFIRGGAADDQTVSLAHDALPAVEAPALRPFPPSETVELARRYCREVPPAISGEGGDAHTFHLAIKLVRGFALTVEEALPVMLEWNVRCAPPWTEAALVHKLECAARPYGTRPVGGLLGGVKKRSAKPKPEPKVVVNVPEDEQGSIVLGVDAARLGGAYIDLAPNLAAGLRFPGNTPPRLAPEMKDVKFKGRDCFVAVPSNYSTTYEVVMNAYSLTVLLRMAGGTRVRLMVPRSPDGRIVTCAEVKAEDIDIRWPPMTIDLARNEALTASSRAKSQPRKRRRSSNAIEVARSWINKNAIKKATADVVERARKVGISKESLRKALTAINKEDSNPSSDNKEPLHLSSYDMSLSESVEGGFGTEVKGPVRRPSKLDQAVRWARDNHIKHLSKDVVEIAMKEGISRRTLARALTAINAG